MFQTILAMGTQLSCTKHDSWKGLGATSLPTFHLTEEEAGNPPSHKAAQLCALNSLTHQLTRNVPRSRIGVLKGPRLIQPPGGGGEGGLVAPVGTIRSFLALLSTLLPGQKRKDSPVPGRRLSRLRGGDLHFVQMEFMFDLWVVAPCLAPKPHA